MLTMDHIDLNDQRVLIREDFNVPMKDGIITHTARIDSALPTIQQALAKNAKVILMSHLGRPKEGVFDEAFSLKPIADYLQKQLAQKVVMFQLGEPVPQLAPGEVALLENVRFLKGEEENSEALSKQLASLCDIFVMDAFAVAHRAQASTDGVAKAAPIACAGPLLQKELHAVEAILKEPKPPVVAIVGGSKVSTKLQLLENLLSRVNTLVVGGGIANTFLAALGHNVGASLYEPELLPVAIALIDKAKKQGKTIWLPEDVIVAHSMDAKEGQVKALSDVSSEDKILDIGPKAQENLKAVLLGAQTILWNGPVGVFELPAFSQGTECLAKTIAQSDAFSVAGGGDTLAAIEQFQVQKGISYLSTGGGAFLEALEGKVLPAVAALMARAKTAS
jgi:phosphoglycerate kinase